ncbi:MAG: NifU family protein [Nannocystis sp.]|uniref:NifU family protein n=1 Tax=Nannocystis sp. TaxID=1962667 RepID=UPI002423BD34|nr:NifU family protein [Nannocystis sp.]
MIGTIFKRLTVRTLDVVVERGKESDRTVVRLAATGLDRVRGWVGLDRIELRTTPPAWDGAQPEQPMWQSDRDKLHKHRVDKGIVKPPAGTTMPVKAAEPAVKLYIKRGCPYCRAAADLLNERSIAFTQIDYSDDHDLRRAIRGQTGRKTSPHVFIHGKSIGGYDELRELDQSGALKELLADKPGDAKPVAPVLPPFDEEDDDSEDEITARSLRTRISEGAKVLLLDVREADERDRSGVLPHAHQIPLGELERRQAELDPAGVWITYCHSGKRSHEAMLFLRQRGFGRVVSLRGGIVAWTEAGGATVSPTSVPEPRRVKLPVVQQHPEKSPFEDLLFPDAPADTTPLTGDALVARVREVLEEVRPMVQSDGGDIELLDIIDDVVGVQLTGNCVSCPSSQATLRQGIERKLKLRIPQIKGISSPQLVPLS